MIQSRVFIICIWLLASCSTPHMSPADAIVDISRDGGAHVGYGVITEDSHILTARHVVDACTPSCRYTAQGGDTLTTSDIALSSEGDSSSLALDGDYNGATIYTREIPLQMPLYALVSRSGAWVRIDGRVTQVDTSYVGYDASLSGQIYTGAIETDIVLDTGESGTPIWTLSGDLLGVMSAVDRERGRGYVVRP